MHTSFLRFGRLARTLAVVAFPWLVGGAAECLASDAGPGLGDCVVANGIADAPTVQIGDKVNVAVFEHLDREEDKWGSGPQRPPDLSHSFLQRAELSGERFVQENGAISFPMLGEVAAAGLSNSQLERAIACVFEHTFGRSGFASVVSVEHSPVSIVGPVRNPGAYKYMPGMTVLHVVALAGGFDRAGTEAWQAVESVRETGQIQRSLDTLARTLARRAVLRAERDGQSVSLPKELGAILGESQGRIAIADQLALRGLIVNTKFARKTALKAAVEGARGELAAANGRLAPIDALAKLRGDRVNALAALVGRGVVDRSVLLQAQADLAESLVRRQDALAAISSARLQFDRAVQEEAAFALETRNELEIEIATLDRETADDLTSVSAGQGVLKVVQTLISGPGDSQARFTFEIVRHTLTGVATIPASDLSEVKPGDLVRTELAQPPREERDRLAPGFASLSELAHGLIKE